MPDLKPKLPQPAVIHTNHYSADEELKPLLAEYDERITEYNRTRSGDQTTNDWSGHIADYHRHSMEHGIARLSPRADRIKIGIRKAGKISRLETRI